jgi:hypothetical protein
MGPPHVRRYLARYAAGDALYRPHALQGCHNVVEILPVRDDATGRRGVRLLSTSQRSTDIVIGVAVPQATPYRWAACSIVAGDCGAIPTIPPSLSHPITSAASGAACSVDHLSSGVSGSWESPSRHATAEAREAGSRQPCIRAKFAVPSAVALSGPVG